MLCLYCVMGYIEKVITVLERTVCVFQVYCVNNVP